MKKGFSLVELLVVIAIIGILSSVVIASLESACKKNPNGCKAFSNKEQTTCASDQCLRFIRNATSTK